MRDFYRILGSWCLFTALDWSRFTSKIWPKRPSHSFCKLREHHQVRTTNPTFRLQIPWLVPPTYFHPFHTTSTTSFISSPSVMQSDHHLDTYRTPRTQANEVYLKGSGNQYPPSYQNDAMQNVYYWYDGCMPYCTDAIAWQPLDSTFLYTTASGYSGVDKSQGVVHPVSGRT